MRCGAKRGCDCRDWGRGCHSREAVMLRSSQRGVAQAHGGAYPEEGPRQGRHRCSSRLLQERLRVREPRTARRRTPHRSRWGAAIKDEGKLRTVLAHSGGVAMPLNGVVCSVQENLACGCQIAGPEGPFVGILDGNRPILIPKQPHAERLDKIRALVGEICAVGPLAPMVWEEQTLFLGEAEGSAAKPSGFGALFPSSPWMRRGFLRWRPRLRGVR